MKKLLTLAVVVASALSANAQSVLVMKVDEKIGKQDFAGAEQVINEEIQKQNEKWEKAKLKKPEALINSEKMAEAYNKLGDVYGLQFNPELMNAAQGLPLDTAKFCTMLDNTVNAYTQSYVYDNTPDAKGKVKPKFNDKNCRQLGAMLDYYYYAGVFLNQNGDTDGSCREFQKFLKMRKNPAFTPEQQDSIYNQKKSLYDQAAFNVCLLNYQGKKWDALLDCIDDAMGDPERMKDAYIMKQQAYIAKGDSAAWLATLSEAVERVEDNTNFMEQLIYYYTTKNDAASANALADKLITKDANNKSAWYMKGCSQLNLEQDYKAARESFLKALAIDPNYMEANLNVAYTYMNEVMKNRQDGKYKIATVKSSYTSKEKPLYDQEMAEIKGYYQDALPYVEKVRELVPNEPRRWAAALAMIYSNLGMKEKADEMDAINAANR